MPYYVYVCNDCGEDFEVQAEIRARPLTTLECKDCGGKAWRVFYPPAIIQTGYKETDARYNRGRIK